MKKIYGVVWLVWIITNAFPMTPPDQQPLPDASGVTPPPATASPAPQAEEAQPLQGPDVQNLAQSPASIVSSAAQNQQQLYTQQKKSLDQLAQYMQKLETIRDTLEEKATEVSQSISSFIQSTEEELGKHQQKTE